MGSSGADDPPAGPKDRLEKVALGLVLGRRALWMLAGAVFIQSAIHGLRTRASGSAALGYLLMGLLGAALSLYAVGSAVRLVRRSSR